MILVAATSLRAAGGVLQILLQRLPALGDQVPCPNSGRMWLLRIGLYEVQRPKPQADDWVWLVDHTIQWGARKCFFLVGVRLGPWQQDRRPLSHHDFQVLALEPVEKSSGDIVLEQFERARAVAGTPREILSDGGTDLQRAIGQFRRAHPTVAGCYDILHKLALLLGKTLRQDPRWPDFLSRAAECQKRTRYTRCAFLSPPTLRERCRTMNLPDLLRWADHVRRFLDDPQANNGQLVERVYVNLEFAWLREFERPIAEWRSLMAITDTTLHYVRYEGYHREASTELSALLQPLTAASAAAGGFVEQVVDFVTAQSAAAHPGERLIGSSEGLESLIGRAKRLLGPHIRHGMTRMILAAAAAVVDLTPQTIATALATVTTEDVDAWAEQWLGKTVQSQRCRMYEITTPPGNKSGITSAPAEAIDF